MSLTVVGFAGRASLYALIALLAGRIAVGLPGESAGAQGAFQALSDLPLGAAALGALAVALAAFGAWAILQAVHPEGEQGVGEQLFRAGQGLVHFGLAVLAGAQLLGDGGGGGNPPTATLMASPIGRVAVAGVGVGLLAVMAVQCWRAWTGRLREEIDDRGRDAPAWASTVGRLGYLGRGLAAGLVGAFITHSAITFDPSAATGLDAALEQVARQPGGRVGVTVLAVGLAVLALWFTLVARYGVEGDVDAGDVAEDG